MKKIFGCLVLASVLAAGTSTAQIPSAPRELGMGGAYMGIARGYEAVFLAPGNFGLADAPRWSFGFPQVALGGTLVGPEFTDLMDLADFDDVPESRQSELLSLIPQSGTQGDFSLRAPLAAFSNGGFVLGVSYASIGRHTLSRDLAELFLEGFEEGRTDYSVGNTFGERATFWDAAVGYGRSFGGISIGATAHYLRGGNIVRSRLFEPRIFLEAQDIEVDYVGVIARGGTGYSLDVGAAIQPHPDVTISAAVTNAFGEMTWSEDLFVRNLTVDREMLDANLSPIDLMNRYRATEESFDPSAASLRAFETAEGLYENAYMPGVARFGVGWNPDSSTHLAADFHRKLTDGRLGEAWDQRISVGIQQSLWITSFRAGYAIGNDGGNMLSGGFSLGPLDLGVARYQHSDIDDTRTRGWIATFGLGVDQPF